MKYYDIMFHVVLLASGISAGISFCSENVRKESDIRASGRSHGKSDSPKKVVYQNSKCVGTFTHLAAVTFVRFNRRCDKIVTITPDNRLVYIWDVNNEQEPLLVFEHKKRRPVEAHFSEDGRLLFTKVQGKDKVYCWSTRDGKRKGFSLSSCQMDYSSDTHELRSGGKAVLIIDQATAKTIQRISHSESVTSAKWSRDGTRIASSAGKHAYMWYVGRTVQEIENKQHNERVLARVQRRPVVEGLSAAFGS